MKFHFRPRTTILCLLAASGMLRASYWQWERHGQKLEYINTLETRLEIPVEPLSSYLPLNQDWQSLIHRRLQVDGKYDFDHEIILRNRRQEEMAGVNIVTPLQLAGTQSYILVNRGFIPLKFSDRSSRIAFQKEKLVSFVGLVKETQSAKFFAPKDRPAGNGQDWVDSWLRIDLENIQKQLPYKLLPFYVEFMGTTDVQAAKERIVSSQAGKEEIFMLQPKNISISEELSSEVYKKYPIADFSSVIPAGRHLGYVYEWAIMAAATLLVGLLLQFRPPRSSH